MRYMALWDQWWWPNATGLIPCFSSQNKHECFFRLLLFQQMGSIVTERCTSRGSWCLLPFWALVWLKGASCGSLQG